MKTIEINTSLNVTIKFNLATLWDRGLAYAIDMAIVWAVIGLFVWFFSALIDSPSQYLFFYIAVPIFGFYTLLFETFKNGQTIGKKAMRLQVIRIDGKRTRTSDYFMRWIFRLIDIYFSGSLIAILTITSSQRAQRLGDILADTCVIKIKEKPEASLSSILKLNELHDQEPKYPEIIKLSEPEMLIIKECIDRYRQYPNEAHEKVIGTLVEMLENLLEIQCKTDKIKFLNELIKDFVILTR
jgi:uncharacterized RDD family membrane protein YckC